MDSTFDGSDGCAGDFGDFLVGHVFDVAQNDGFSVFSFKVGDGLLDYAFHLQAGHEFVGLLDVSYGSSLGTVEVGVIGHRVDVVLFVGMTSREIRILIFADVGRDMHHPGGES